MASEQTFNPKKFLADNVDRFVDSPPEFWRLKLQSLLKDLPAEDSAAVNAEANRLLASRKKIIAGITDSVDLVRGLKDSEGRPYGDWFKGVLLYGSITGKRWGRVVRDKALDFASFRGNSDIDLLVVVTSYPKGTFEQMAERLGEEVGKRTGFKVYCGSMIGVDEHDPQVMVQHMRNQAAMNFPLYPKPWFFIGDPTFKESVSDSIKRYTARPSKK
ncbi:MAG: hypothetical protein KKD39_03875 [Candidatus Altiarchaeota archaeon]|nr:hypothetical protein [Candidatus Altiarchaeota archaeon]